MIHNARQCTKSNPCEVQGQRVQFILSFIGSVNCMWINYVYPGKINLRNTYRVYFKNPGTDGRRFIRWFQYYTMLSIHAWKFVIIVYCVYEDQNKAESRSFSRQVFRVFNNVLTSNTLSNTKENWWFHQVVGFIEPDKSSGWRNYRN